MWAKWNESTIAGTLCALLVLTVYAEEAQAQTVAGRNYGRSVVASTEGIVATSQVIASQVGAEMLARGGSAADAAIAANLILSVVEPMMCGPGGDLFAIYRDARSGQLFGLNASGWSPAGLTLERVKSRNVKSMDEAGIDRVTVPGAVHGWAQLHSRFGKLPWRDLFRPAIRIATEGFPVSERTAVDWKDAIVPSCVEESCKRVLLPKGAPPQFGEVFRNPDMAKALDLIARKGPQEFYRGSIAKALLATSTRLGGTMTSADLSELRPEWVAPIAADYKGWKVYELPPNGRGIVVLEALGLLGTVKAEPSAAKTPDIDAIHARIEAMRLANADVWHLADPRTNANAGAGLLNPAYLRDRAALIDLSKAQCVDAPGPPPSDTTFIAAVDRDGNMVSLIQSLATGESGIVVDGMGFLLQDRGRYFSLDANAPNVVAPRKRTSHTLMPAHMEMGNTHLAFGFVGGPTQPVAQMQFVSNVVDFGMNIQEAMEAPLFDLGAQCKIYMERRVPAEVRQGLASRGHVVEETDEYDPYMGLGQAVLWDSGTKMKYGASSPRADGAAIPAAPRW